MASTIDDILGKIKPPVRSAWVCLDGELWSRHDELSKAIDELRAQNPSGKMADARGVAPLSKELRDVEAAMQAAEVEFKFRGLSSYKRDEIIERFPKKNGGGWDTTAGAHALLAAAAVDPVMSEDKARQLIEQAHHGVTTKLFNAAWLATEGSSDVPFSARAFGSTSGTGSS